MAEHATLFPHGELVDMRVIARIMALCQVGKTALARDEAQQFLKRSPNSPYSARVRTLCTGSPP